jgi:hypothetical protein
MSATRRNLFITVSLAGLAILFSGTMLRASENPLNPGAKFFNARLQFEPNLGQSAPDADFVSHGKGFMVHLNSAEAVFTLPHERLSMHLADSNRDARASSLEPFESRINYFVGNDPSKWLTGIPTYGKARYQNVYPGIDVVYYGNGEQLEYDFIVAPNADPNRIALRFPEARRLRVNRDGALLITANQGTLQFHKPVAYQEVNGRRIPVAGRYTISGDRVGFELAQYDRGRRLVIDPTLSFSVYLGGGKTDEVHAITADSSSNVYVTGFTQSTDFPTQPASGSSVYQSSLIGQTAAFLTKLNSSGSIVFSTYFGGTDVGSNTRADAIARDGSGNIYIAGRTDSNALPVTPGVPQSTRRGTAHANAFVTKFNASGIVTISTYLGGTGNTTSGCIAGDEAHGVAVDSASGNVYVTGSTDSSDFPGSPGTPACIAGFVLGLNFARTQPILFARLIGGQNNTVKNSGNAVAIDQAGTTCLPGSPTSPAGINVYVTGQVSTTDNGDVYAGKFDSSGNSCYEMTVAGSSTDTGNSVTVDATGNAYIAGASASANFPVTPDAKQGTFGGARAPGDAVVMKLGPAGTTLYASFLGGSSFDQANGIALDPQGNVSIAGQTQSTDFPTVNPFPFPYGGGWDVFVARFDATFATEFYATFIGGSSDDFGIGLAVAPTTPTQNNTFVGGYTASTNFPKTINNRNANNASNTGFVALIGDVNPPTPTRLGFTSQPQNAQVSTPIPDFTVGVQDTGGNTVSNATNAITVALTTNITGATLSGNTTVNAVNGVATFSGLSIDQAGTYTFTASSPNLVSDVSQPFTITATRVTIGVSTFPFASFDCDAVTIDLRKTKNDPDDDKFHLDCDFTLGPGSNGISPPTESFTLKIAGVTVSVPAGSFRDDGKGKPGPYTFNDHDKNGIDSNIQISMKTEKNVPVWEFHMNAKNADFGSMQTGDHQMVTVTLTIGGDSGTITTPAKVH